MNILLQQLPIEVELCHRLIIPTQEKRIDQEHFPIPEGLSSDSSLQKDKPTLMKEYLKEYIFEMF